MRPTPRAVAIFAAGIPLALFMVIYNPGLWQWSLGYAALAFIAIAGDAALAMPRPSENSAW